MSVDDFTGGPPPPRCVVETDVAVTITVRNADALDRVTGPNGDEWRAQFYRLHTVEDVLEHWTYNALVNGVFDVRRLEGWADLAAGAVAFDVEHADLAIREAK